MDLIFLCRHDKDGDRHLSPDEYTAAADDADETDEEG